MIDKIDNLIDAMGGTTAVAAMCDVSPAAVSMWRMRGGIPANKYLILSKEIGKLSLNVDLRLFGFREKESGS